MSGTQSRLSGELREAAELEADRETVPEDVRNQVFRIAYYSCMGCGTPHVKSPLQIHHRQPRSDGGPHVVSNLSAFCSECHTALHKFLDRTVSMCHPAEIWSKSEQGLPENPASNLLEAISVGELRMGLADSDAEILLALHQGAPLTSGDIGAAVSVSTTQVYRRLLKLAAHDIVMQSRSGEWHFAGRVDDSKRGVMPDTPSQQAKRTRDAAAVELREAGYSYAEIADQFGITENVARTAVYRGRAFQPPAKPMEALGISPADLRHSAD